MNTWSWRRLPKNKIFSATHFIQIKATISLTRNVNESYILKCKFNLMLPIWGSFWPETTNTFTFSASTGCFKHENI